MDYKERCDELLERNKQLEKELEFSRSKSKGVVTNISKHKEYEYQIEREKAFLEHLYNSTPEAIAITNPYGIISMINREFTSLFSFTSEEAVNNNVNDLIVPDDLKEEAIGIDSLTSQNQKVVRQTIRKDKSGKKIKQ